MIVESKFKLSSIISKDKKNKLASIFLRFKPLFLAFKKSHRDNRSADNYFNGQSAGHLSYHQ